MQSPHPLFSNKRQPLACPALARTQRKVAVWVAVAAALLFFFMAAVSSSLGAKPSHAMKSLPTKIEGSERCFVASEGTTTLKHDGDCATRHSPCSTFKLPLALIGFEKGILESPEAPRWDPPSGTTFYMTAQSGTHDPRTWIRDSAVWYSQEITRRLGADAIHQAVADLGYGNADTAGLPGQKDGLTEFWLMSSLQISPDEQVAFLRNLLEGKLPVSTAAMAQVRQIFFLEELWGGWKLFGKTGTGYVQNARGQATKQAQGWFIGWIEKDGRIIPFASYVNDVKAGPASLDAKNHALKNLFWIISSDQK